MNLRDLSYFLAVYETKHFSKAAERCFVSQPALSMQIKKLEQRLGVVLFERSGKQFVYTPFSHQLADHARGIFKHMDRINALAQSYQDPFENEFSIGAFPTISPYLFSRLAPSLHHRYPNLTLLLQEEKSELLMDRLKEGEIDVAILSLPHQLPSMESRVLFQDEFFIAVSREHSWASRGEVCIDELTEESVLLLEDGHCLRDQCLDICLKYPEFKSHSFRATSLFTLKQMVATGVGITLLPQSVRTVSDELVYIPIKGRNLLRTIGCVWRKKMAKEEVVHAVLEVCEELFQ
jgi:LysR family transcriptional regulator, hydrogen peroxide-inducible genes activator